MVMNMRKMLLPIVCVIALFGASAPDAGAGPSLAREVAAAALKLAQHAEADARAAVSLAKRIPGPVRGDTGPKGDTGARGLSGANGSDGQSGARGADGAKGADGANGSRGEQGPRGDTGPQGPQGVAGSSVKAYGHVTASGTGTTTQGTTVTHPGSGSYCIVDQGFVAVVATPDRWDATTFALPPDSPNNSCGPGRWTVIVSSSDGVDTGVMFIAN